MVDPGETPGPIDAAVRQDFLVDRVRQIGSGRTFSIWAVIDNLTVGGARNALGLIESWR